MYLVVFDMLGNIRIVSMSLTKADRHIIMGGSYPGFFIFMILCIKYRSQCKFCVGFTVKITIKIF